MFNTSACAKQQPPCLDEPGVLSNPVMKLPWNSPRNKVPYKWSAPIKELCNAYKPPQDLRPCKKPPSERITQEEGPLHWASR